MFVHRPINATVSMAQSNAVHQSRAGKRVAAKQTVLNVIFVNNTLSNSNYMCIKQLKFAKQINYTHFNNSTV